MFPKDEHVLNKCSFSYKFLFIFVLLAQSTWAEEDLDAFFRAVTDGRGEIVSQCLKAHPEWVNRELYHGISPLYRAAVLGRSEVTQILLESGAQVTVKTDRQSHALHAASQNGHLGVVMLLLANKAPVSAKNEDGMSSLHLAARHKRLKVLKELLRNGASTEAVDDEGRTALHYAAGLGRLDLVKLLVEAGAELSPVDKNGYSPLGRARTLKRNSYGDVGGYLDAKGGQDIRPESEDSK